MSGSSDSQPAPHAWDASGTLWNPMTMSSHAIGPAEGIIPKPQRPRGRSAGRTSCQVPGCTESLMDCKPYFKRHLVCQTHAVSPTVVMDGVEMRFCQQCAKFERLTAFDGGNRSCRLRLFRRNVAKHRSQLAKRVAQSGDEPEPRPARQSQHSKHTRVPSLPDVAGNTSGDAGDGMVDADGAGQPGTSSSQPQERSGGSSGEPDTRCWDAGPAPSHFRGAMGGEDWRSQAVSGPTKRTKVAVSDAAAVAAAEVEGLHADLDDPAMALARQPHSRQRKRRQRTVPQRPREESNSESRTLQSQNNSDVNDDVDATLAPLTLGLRLDRRSEDTEPSANKVGGAGATTPELPQCTSAVQSASPNTQPPPKQSQQAPRQQQHEQQSRSLSWWEERAPARAGRVLHGIHRGGAALYDTISALVTEPAQRSDAHAITATEEAATRRFRDMAPGLPSFGAPPCVEATLAEDGTSSNVPLAMQALSNRPDLAHSDRQTLESLLGLAPGPFMTLRAMSASTSSSLDEQLYDIMHDVMKDGGSDTGWFSGVLPAETKPAAPPSAVGRPSISNATGSVAAARTYLGAPMMEPEKRGVSAAPDSRGNSRSELPYSQGHPSAGYGDDGRRLVWGVGPGEFGATMTNPKFNEMGDGGGLQTDGTLHGPGRAPAATALAAAAHEGVMPAWAQVPQYQPQAQQPLQQQQQQSLQTAPQQHHQPQQHYRQQYPLEEEMVLHQQHLPSQQQQQQFQQQPMQLPQQTSTELQLQELQQQQRNLEHKLQELQQRKMQLQQQQQQRVMAPASVNSPAASVAPCDSAPCAGTGGSVSAGPMGAFPDQLNTHSHQQVHEHRHHSNMQHHYQQHYQHPLRSGTSNGKVEPTAPISVQTHGHMRPHLYAHPQPHVGVPAPGYAGQPGAMPPGAPPHTKQQLLPPKPVVVAPPPPPIGAVVMGAPPGPGSCMAPSWGNIPPPVRSGGGGNGDMPYPGRGDGNGHRVGTTAGALAGAWGTSQATESAWDDYYHSPYGTVRLSLKMMECSPYDMDPALTQEMLHQMASEGGRCNVPPPLASVRPGCVRIVFNATVRAADCEEAGDLRGMQGRDLDQEPFSARSDGVMAAVRQLAMANETAVMLQAGNNQVVSVDKTGGEVTPGCSGAAAAALPLPPPVLTRASMAAVYIGARGSFQVHGSGLSGPNVELWGRIHGVHYHLQVQHTYGDSYALIQLPALPSCGLLVVEAAAGADAALLSDWLALLVVPTERVAAELNGLQNRISPASMRRLLVDFGSLLDVLPLLSQPVNGVTPVLGQLGGASSGCSKNTWRSSSVDPELAGGITEAVTCCGGDAGDSSEGPGSSDAAATEAGVLSFNVSYADTLSTLASSHGEPLCKLSSTAAASLRVGVTGAGISGMSATTADGQYSSSVVRCGSASGRAAVAAVLTSIADDGGGCVQATAAPNCCGAGGAPVKLSAYLLANLAERAAIADTSAFGGNGVGGWGAAAAAFGNSSVRRLLRGFDPSELLTNGDDETVLQLVLGTEAVRLLLARVASVTMFFAERMLLDSALCVASALSELYFAFPDLLRADLAPTPTRGAPNLMHAAVRTRSLALMLALAKCSPVLGDNVSLAWRGPGGITPLHLVALLAQPYIITGLQFAAPDIREMWHNLRDDNGVSPADLLAQALQPVYGVTFSASVAGAVRAPCTREAATPPSLPPPPAASKESFSRVLLEGQRTVLRVGPQMPPLAGAGPNTVDTTSEQGSDFFQTPLPSPSTSTSLPKLAKRCDGDSPSVVVASVRPPSESLWLDGSEVAVVLSSQRSKAMNKAELDNGAEGDVSGLTAVAGSLSRTAEGFPVAGVSAGDAAGVAASPDVPILKSSKASVSEEPHGLGAAQEPEVAAGPLEVPHKQQLIGKGLSSFTGLALNLARRLMPW
ncbi:hypothetical protein Vretimale_17027 [Volvox reticuliferus]|uniref:Uncharacterized protein n=1 Tax=Volvox reticuliferus TaxID=1737510 RepID=A0A8J4LXB8_9CHLO|nr:hypothetical protein Vretifemale_7821 [Volvox reticuliferus]GIM13925.1 hypothetical protein Vretimale_17027 [Volvox reticuliferus]